MTFESNPYDTRPPLPDLLARHVETAKMIAQVTSVENNTGVARVEKRKPVPENALCSSAGKGKLIQPDQELIGQLVQNGKIEYVNTAGSERFKTSEYPRMTEPEYSHSVFMDLLARVRGDLDTSNGKTKYAFRGITASINGTVDHVLRGSTEIPDVTQIVESGGERNHDKFNVAVGDLGDDDYTTALNLHRVNQYASNAILRRLDVEQESPKDAECLFPAVLVYDVDSLQSAEGAWTVQLREGATMDAALLKVYILDCPALN